MNKILFVESYPHVLFGQQGTLLALLDACPAAIKPVVAATAEGPFVDEVRRRGIPVTILPYPQLLSPYGGAIYGYRGGRRLRMLGQWAGYVWSIRRTLRSLAVDGVHCNDMRGLLTVGLAARSLGMPVLTWDKLDKPHGWLDWLQLPLVTLNPVISNAVTVKYPRWQRRWYARKIIRVSEGADLVAMDQARSIRETLPVEPNDLLLAMVGAITHRKGQDRILAVFDALCRRLPRLHLLIIGATSGSPEDERYRASLPHRAHPRVHWLGQREDVPDLMQSIDILLIPSRHEGTPLVIFEAMAAGKPVIGARAGGIPEVVVEGETGLLFDGDDPEQLRACIERLADSPELRARMGVAGRRRVEQHFNRPVQMRQILQLCLEMLEPDRGWPRRDE